MLLQKVNRYVKRCSAERVSGSTVDNGMGWSRTQGANSLKALRLFGSVCSPSLHEIPQRMGSPPGTGRCHK